MFVPFQFGCLRKQRNKELQNRTKPFSVIRKIAKEVRMLEGRKKDCYL